MAKARFEWDSKKDKENQEKHGVSFVKAQFAFADPHRVIAEDASHSSGEKRQYCIG
ncbi:MAG: BrnT family toxin, partial [Nitrospirota bacterium]|nr:BrnT family toxin [Nitrospirota bacterium]